MLSEEPPGDARCGDEDSQWPWGEVALCKLVSKFVRVQNYLLVSEFWLAQEPDWKNGRMPRGDAAEIPNASGQGQCEAAART